MDREKELIESSYDLQSKVYDSLFEKGGPFYEREYRILDEELVVPARVLDLGCGTARHSIYLARKGVDVCGIDLSSGMLEKARDNIRKAGVSVTVIKGDMTDLSQFEKASFEYVICMYQSFGYVPTRKRRKQVIQEIHRVLKPKGKAIFVVWNLLYDITCPKYWTFLLRTSLGLVGKRLEFGDTISEELCGAKTYSHIFTPREFKGYFELAGFSRIALNFINRDTGSLNNSAFRYFTTLGMYIIAQK